MCNNFGVRVILSGVLFIFVLCNQLQPLFANHVHNHHSSHNGQHSKWFRSEILDGNGLFILDWKKTAKDIIFRATVNTRGFIGIGFSYKSEKIGDADIVLAWVDDRTGEPNVLVNKIKKIEQICWTQSSILMRKIISQISQIHAKSIDEQSVRWLKGVFRIGSSLMAVCYSILCESK